MDGAVDAAAAEEGGVGGVDDGVDLEGGDIGLEDLDWGMHEGIIAGREGCFTQLNAIRFAWGGGKIVEAALG